MVAGCGGDAALLQKMIDFQQRSSDEVVAKAERLEALGTDAYLKQKDAPKSTVVM
jgi:hypothetical protein